MTKVLVSGGAGYIGSHVVKALGMRGYEVLVYDNLSSGRETAVLAGRLVKGDLADRAVLDEAIRSFKPHAVMHFAASIGASESVRDPITYYRNNTGNTLELLDSCIRHRIGQLIFSSTAAVYGIAADGPVGEDAPLAPINPYGRSKMMSEMLLRDLAAAVPGFRFVSLRYFNAAGADANGLIGERHKPETHLVPLVLKAAKGELPRLDIFGTDYPTPDGTCIRDYVHVADIADAHIAALEYLDGGGKSDTFNIGYGKGYSVREIVQASRKITGKDLAVRETARREGDPPVLIADSAKIRRLLHWTPKYDDLDHIIRTAWEWEKKI